MVVDDHPIMRSGLRDTLEASGRFEVVGQAEDGEEAVRTVEGIDPQVIVMDVFDHVIAVNEQHLRRVLGEYVQHYNAMRPHRSLSLDSPEGRSPVQRTPSQRVVSKPVLGGLHHEYRWAA